MLWSLFSYLCFLSFTAGHKEFSPTAQKGGDLLPDYCHYRNRRKHPTGLCGNCYAGFSPEYAKIRNDGIVVPCIRTNGTVHTEDCTRRLYITDADAIFISNNSKYIVDTFKHNQSKLLYITVPSLNTANVLDVFKSFFNLTYRQKMLINMKHSNRLNSEEVYQMTSFHHPKTTNNSTLIEEPNSESLTIHGNIYEFNESITNKKHFLRNSMHLINNMKLLMMLNSNILRILSLELFGSETSLLLNSTYGHYGKKSNRRYVDNYNWFLDVIRYWNISEYMDKGEYLKTIDYRVTPHTDVSFMTLIIPEPGLRFLCNGNWVQVKTYSNTVVIFPGHLLTIVTHDKIQPILHDVLGIPLSKTNGTQGRISVTLQNRPIEGQILKSASYSSKYEPRLVTQSHMSIVKSIPTTGDEWNNSSSVMIISFTMWILIVINLYLYKGREHKFNI